MKSQKLPFLEISPEKYRQQLGDGSYSTGCPTPTGDHTSATPQPSPASSLPTVAPLRLQWAGTSKRKYQDAEYKMGEEVFNRTLSNRQFGWVRLPQASQDYYTELAIAEKTPKERGLCECGLVAQSDCLCHANGSNGETSLDQQLFWNSRIPVRQKG